MYWKKSIGTYAPKNINKDAKLLPRLEGILKENLNSSTQTFITSLRDFCKTNGGLTDNQLTAFVKVESRYSKHEQAKLVLWEKEYKTKYLADAKLLAKYYVKAGYFSNIAHPINDEPEYIPARQSFMRMLNNSYAQKVLAETRRPAKFGTNEMVQIRQTFGKDGRMDKRLKNRLCFVMANDLQVVSAVAGGKRYQVLPMGHDRPITLEERHIMKPNKKGVGK